MRFGFYTSLTFAALVATQLKAISIDEETQNYELAEQDAWDPSDQELAQIEWSGADYADYELAQLSDEDLYDNFAQVEGSSDSGSESEADSGSGSNSESGSGSGSDSENGSNNESDDEFTNLELAQQLQELNYLNALGTINAAQVQAMQQMGARTTACSSLWAAASRLRPRRKATR